MSGSVQPVPVLLLARELGVGGSERQLVEMAKALDRTRFIPHVGCMREGFRCSELRAAGVPVAVFPVRSLYGPSALAGAWQLRSYLMRHNIQLVHAFDVPMNLFAVPVARLIGTPVILSSQRAFRGLTPGLRRRLLRLTDRLADGVVVNSEAVRQHLIEDESVPAEKIHLCHNGIDIACFTPRPPPDRPDLTIGVVCALRPEKDIATLIRAFAKARQPHWRLMIVGSGPCLSELQTLVRDLALTHATTFHATTDQVPARLREMDIFVLSSLSESFSNALMEAMASGCAVVASRAGGNPELVIPGETGLLFEAGQSDELAAVLLRLGESAALRKQLAASASEFIRSRFTVAAAAHRLEEIYGASLRWKSAAITIQPSGGR
jgi:glycosyltransferase involved in cell wall biosynthesis